MRRCTENVLAVALLAFCSLRPAAAQKAGDINAAMAERGAIFTYLLDTGEPAPDRLPPAAIQAKRGWALVESEQSHPFSGDAVIVNDKLAVVLRRNSGGADVYTLRAGTPVYRASLLPCAANGESAQTIRTLALQENTPGAVAVTATAATEAGTPLRLTYRLTTGQIQVEMVPADGIDAIRIVAPTACVVVPDFFADDLVFGPGTTSAAWDGLPAENFYLHLLGNGNAILTCVWESHGRDARVLYADGTGVRPISASEIQCVAGKSVWAAFSEGTDTWHTRELAAENRDTSVALDWAPPFEAQWRASFAGASPQAQSWPLNETTRSGADAAAQDGSAAPCWMEGETPEVRLPAEITPPAKVVVYPVDRTRATPLNRYVLVDIMRGTLGMGPCQYILDIEGLDAQTSPTPALVCDWVESRLEKGRGAREADRIRERLTAMVHHVDRAEQRIARYAAFQRELVASLDASGVENGPVHQLLREMDDTITALETDRKSPAHAREWARRIQELLGPERDWQADFRQASDALHALGAAQDRTLAKCRMYLRRLEQLVRYKRETGSPDHVMAATIGDQIGSFLRRRD